MPASARRGISGRWSARSSRLRAAVVMGAAMALAVSMSTTAIGAATASPVKTESSQATKKFTIAFVPGETTDAFFISMHQGVYNEAKKLGMGVIYQGASTYSPEAQIPVVQAVLAKHPSGLLIASTDVKALNAPIAAYKAKGIPVITLDSTISDSGLLAGRITSDNTQGGAAAADAIAKLAHDRGQVAVISQIPGISTTDARAAGFEKELKKYPGMKFLGIQYDNGNISTAASEASSLMLAHPGLVGIFGANDYAAEGAGDAVKSAGKSGKVFIAGYDAEPKEVQYVKNGTIDILVVQRPKEEGVLGVQYMYDILTGHADKVPKLTQLTNVIATKANINSPQVTQWLYQPTFHP